MVIAFPPMESDIGEKIKEAREQRGWSQQDLATAVGVSQPAIVKIEAGITKRSRHLPDIRRLLDLEEEQPRPRPSTSGIYRPPPDLMNVSRPMPVYASAEGGQGHLIIDIHPIDHVPRPYTLEGIDDAYGILITGESMVPAYKPGDIAWVNPRLPPQRDTECILYRVDDGNGEAMATIKNLVGWTDKDWQLEQYNPAKRFPLPRREWTKHHRVVGNFRRR